MKLITKIVISVAIIICWETAKADPICSGTTGYVPYPIVGNARAISTIQLTPGHWDCTVAMQLQGDSGTTVSAAMISLSQIANHMEDFPWTATSGPNGGPGYGMSLSTMPARLDVTTPTTYYINALVYFVNGTVRLRSAFHCTNITISD